MVSIGAVIHALLSVKAALRRLLRRRPKSARGLAPAALPQPSLAGPRAPWLTLRLDEDALTNPAAYAPPAKGGTLGACRFGFAARGAAAPVP